METKITPYSGKGCGKIERRRFRIHPKIQPIAQMLNSKVREAIAAQEYYNKNISVLTKTLPMVIPINSLYIYVFVDLDKQNSNLSWVNGTSKPKKNQRTCMFCYKLLPNINFGTFNSKRGI